MSGLCRWLGNIAANLTSGQRVPILLRLPADVFVNICEWLSVRDVLALRMTNKWIALLTQESTIWSTLLRKLLVPLPLLPATSKHRFGALTPRTYERLLVRGLYLAQNWGRPNPVAAHSKFEAGDTTVLMRLLPGGKYLVSVTRNRASGIFSLVVWDLDCEGRGRRVALTSATSRRPLLKLEAKYGTVNGSMSIIIAFATPPVQPTEPGTTATTTVIAFAVPLTTLEDLAAHHSSSAAFHTLTETLRHPFTHIHHSETSCHVGQLALGELPDGTPLLVVVHRPRALVFHYLATGRRGNLLLGPVHPYADLRHSIWSVKLLAYQSTILVSRLLIEHVPPQAAATSTTTHPTPPSSTLFVLDMFPLPGAGTTYKNPTPVGRQLISGLHIDGFAFSDLETAWFAGLHDPEGLIPAPANTAPPPISIFITTTEPRGFVHCILHPRPAPHSLIRLPYKRGVLRHYSYALPARKVARDAWTDVLARPVVMPGAYRTVVSMRPHVRRGREYMDHDCGEGETPRGTEMLRLCVYATPGAEYHDFSTTRATGNLRVESDGELVEEDDRDDEKEDRQNLRVPQIPSGVAWDMMEGTTALAWDESTGRMCAATSADTALHVLDFGGEMWQADSVCL